MLNSPPKAKEKKMLGARPARTEKQKLEKVLPNRVRGWVCKQFVKRDGRVFGPYWYRFWREGGKLRKAYIRAADLEETRANCDAWQRSREAQRFIRERARESTAKVRDLEARVREAWEARYGEI